MKNKPANRREILNELREISPELANIRKTEQLDAPEGYFDTLPDKVMARVQSRQPRFRYLNRNVLRIAAAVLVLAAIGFLMVNPFKKDDQPQFSMNEDEALYYLSSNLEDYEALQLYALLDQQDFSVVDPIYSEEDAYQYLELFLDEIDETDIESFLEMKNYE